MLHGAIDSESVFSYSATYNIKYLINFKNETSTSS